MSERVNHDTWRDQWIQYLEVGDYAAAERLVSENLVSDECVANAHDDCPLDEVCKCPHHSAGREVA